MVIRATATELDLSGTPAELRLVAQSLAELCHGRSLTLAADLTADAAPYDRLLAVFEVTASDGPVRVTVAGEALRATGSPEFLRKQFASFFRFREDAPRGAHTHHEWYEGNECIAADSMPLVISVA